MTNLREAAQMALSGIEMIPLMKDVDSVINLMRTTQEALRAALAQPEPEAIMWVHDKRGWVGLHEQPQREWQGLTDEEILSTPFGEHDIDYARAIENKLKEKNHG